jgi:hypothetical protein
MTKRRLSATILALLCCVAAAAADADHQAVIDWSGWHALLRAHVADGQVDYDAIAGDPAFAATVADIADANLAGHERTAVLAFNINAYNVLAVKGILDGHSPRGGLGRLRFFYRHKYTVAGETLTLNKLEHERIRTLGEPRIHFAIVCASASCPPLRSEMYSVETLDQQLDDSARRFVNDPTKNRFDTDAGVAQLSKIFKWFDEDFEAAAESVQKYLADFVDDTETAEALRQGRFTVKYLAYDWSLNGSFSGEGR